MIKILSSLILIFSSSVQLWSIPVLIHATSNPVTEGNAVTKYTARLPVPILNGNAGIAFLDNAAGADPTNCTDNNSVAWTKAAHQDDTNQRVSIWYRLNITDGTTRTLSCNFSPAKAFVNLHVTEWSGIATSLALDNTCGANYTSATVLDCSANMTFAQTGDLVVAYGTQTDIITTVGAWTAGASPAFSWIIQDTLDSAFIEYLIYNSTTAFKPVMTADASHSILMVAAGFKAAAVGTLPSGMFPVNVYHGRHGSADTTPVWRFACRGDENLITIIWNGAAGRTISAASTTSTGTTGTWAEAGSGSQSGGSGKNQHIYLPSATCTSNITITPSLSGGSEPDSEFMIVSWINSASAPLTGTPQLSTGNDVTGNPFTGSSTTPTAGSVGGWIISYLGSNTGAGSESQGSPGNFISPDTVPVIDTSPVGENQGAVLFKVPSVSTYTVTWTPNSIAIGTYADYQTLWSPSAGGGGGGSTNGSLMTVGVGK